MAKLAKALSLPEYREPVQDNPYLGMFYKDMTKWGFAMQVFLLNARFAQHQRVVWSVDGGIFDRTIYEDQLFAKILYDGGQLTRLEYDTYIDLFLNMSKFLQRPDLVIYLDVAPEVAYRRLQERSRTEEVGVSLEYLTTLRNEYEHWYTHMNGVLNIVKLDWNAYQDTEVVVKLIQGQLERTNYTKSRWGNHL